MGLFNFIKEAGASVFGGDSGITEEQTEKKIVDFVTSNIDFTVVDFGVNVVGDTAIISGNAASQVDREKLILAVGNIEGISQVKDDSLTVFSVAKTEAIEPRFYVVKKGDSLSKIAKEYYGDAMKYPEIFEANKPLLKNPESIYPGQTLRIPEDI